MAKKRGKPKKNNNGVLITLLIIFVLVLMILLFFDDIKKIYDSKKENTIIDNSTNKNEKDKNSNQVGDKNNQKDNNSIKNDKDNKKDDESLDIKKDNEEQSIHENKNKIEASIKLNGDRKITLKLGEKYVEYGAKAYDSDGNDISSNITIDNQVNINEKGKYLVIYYIGNVTAVRTVIVE